jgi:ATP-dependent DNA ligase
VTLPLDVAYAPMEAKLVGALPAGDGWQYEPKWDGFRCLAFKDGDAVDLRSKAGQPFNRYFPELAEAVGAIGAARAVLDGEIVIPVGDVLSFDDLLMRIHPAASRVAKLARDTPALMIVFDLLVDDRGRSLVDEPLATRRARLEEFMAAHVAPDSPLRLSPVTRDHAAALEWLHGLGSGLDGVIAKRVDADYRSGERTGMEKYKRMRTADCVVGGFRYAASGKVLGSLLLGLYDDEGLLNHVGFTSSFKAAERAALARKVEPLVGPPGFTGRSPGGPSRWSTERTGEWEPIKAPLVVEVQYDHFSGGRFRHGTKLIRWRPDKAPRQCTEAQVAQESASLLGMLESGGASRGKGARRSP